ncbi:hypothetical protein [uncultured Sunxiuqinia sp.]|uniref:hypothetical protein n=1 Tax=uncultured Sunxiuqinia sp. TaxID=1573825 RepID=UPI002AA94049|nr:hypothetical protein [uncultured Sunxiuqinia sp.]
MMILNNIKQSLRSLKYNKLFSGLNIGGLAVGFAISMILALYSYKKYTVDKVFPAYSTVYRLINGKTSSPRIDLEFV